MGNTAGKEIGGSSGSGALRKQSEGAISTSAFTREYLVDQSRQQHGHSLTKGISKRKKEKDMERVRIREQQIMDLIIKYDESVDGGYLAPFDNYKYDLDYNTEIVKSLVIKRKLSPFFTPLQDFDASWSDEELLNYLRGNLILHENIKPNDLNDDYEDPNEHKLHMSVNSMRRREAKLYVDKVKERAAELQNFENSRFKKDFRNAIKDPKHYLNIPSSDLLLHIYRNSEECPICFLYLPNYLNMTRCCSQPICTECFVQMKRSKPHFPHDENNNGNQPAEGETDPEKLISEPVKCPFCAVSNFGVTYTPPTDFNTGIEGKCKPGEYKFIYNTIAEEGDEEEGEGKEGEGEEEDDDDDEVALTELDLADPFSTRKKKIKEKKKQRRSSSVTTSTKNGSYISRRRTSIPADNRNVVTIDAIRPDWEQNLLAARTKMARRSAAATALHATSLLENDEPGYLERHAQRNSHANRCRNQGAQSYQQQQQQQLEERLIEEAMRLSLLDEEERQLKERLKRSM